MEHIIRLLKTIDMLSRPEGATVNGMSKELEISTRQVRRWINQIETMGFPLYDSDEKLGKEKLWKMNENYTTKLPNITIPNLNLTGSETIALLLLWSRADIFKGTKIYSDLTLVFNKLFSFDPSKIKRFESIHQLFMGGDTQQKYFEGKEGMLSDLINAIFSSLKCEIFYHSFSTDKKKELTISPLYLFRRNGGFYLLTTINDYTDIRTIALERILKLKLSDKNFTTPTDFNPEEYLSNAFYLTFDDPLTVKIRFTPDMAKFIKEKKWAKEQSIVTDKDGYLTLTMKTSGREDVKRWILSFGKKAEIIEPEDLRQDILNEAIGIEEIYK